MFLRYENEKKRVYNRRVIEIEKAIYTPLVFGTRNELLFLYAPVQGVAK